MADEAVAVRRELGAFPRAVREHTDPDRLGPPDREPLAQDLFRQLRAAADRPPARHAATARIRPGAGRGQAATTDSRSRPRSASPTRAVSRRYGVSDRMKWRMPRSA